MAISNGRSARSLHRQAKRLFGSELRSTCRMIQTRKMRTTNPGRRVSLAHGRHRLPRSFIHIPNSPPLNLHNPQVPLPCYTRTQDQSESFLFLEHHPLSSRCRPSPSPHPISTRPPYNTRALVYVRHRTIPLSLVHKILNWNFSQRSMTLMRHGDAPCHMLNAGEQENTPAVSLSGTEPIPMCFIDINISLEALPPFLFLVVYGFASEALFFFSCYTRRSAVFWASLAMPAHHASYPSWCNVYLL